MNHRKKSPGEALIILSVIAVVLAAVGALFGRDVWLASTQWLLVAVTLGVWAVYAQLRKQ